jgi:hypothetical protein
MLSFIAICKITVEIYDVYSHLLTYTNQMVCDIIVLLNVYMGTTTFVMFSETESQITTSTEQEQ